MLRLTKAIVYTPAVLFATTLLATAQELPPGIVNHSDGHVELSGQIVAAENAEMAVVYPGETLRTGSGHAEVLLTPGVYLRVGKNSAIRFQTAEEDRLKFELVSGEAIVEVDQVSKDKRLQFTADGAFTQFDRPGLFGFNTQHHSVVAYKGRLRVDDDRRSVELRAGEQLFLSDVKLRPCKFDFQETDSLYAWSQKRAEFASQVSEGTGSSLLALDWLPKYTEGWYWNPWLKSYAFIPAKGYVVTPFGYGLYAPQTAHTATPVFADFR